MLKIAVYHNLPPGGAKRAVYEELKYLSKKYTVDLFELSSTDESFLDVRPFAANLFIFNFNIDITSRNINKLVKDYRNFFTLNSVHKKIAELIDKRGYDVALIHGDRFTQAPFLLRHLRTRHVYFCEEYLRIVYEKQFEFKEKVSVYKTLYEKMTRKIRKYIDKSNAISSTVVVANSQFTKKNIDLAYGINSNVCQLGVNPRIFKKHAVKAGKYVLLIGDKSETDDFVLISNALKKIDAKKRPKLKILGLSKGKMAINNDIELAKQYSGAIATVCTHRNEPFGIAPLESMACETPVIAVNEGGYRETVVNNVTGFLVDRNSNLISEKIKYLINNSKARSVIARNGRRHVLKNFTWIRHCECLEKYL